MAKDTQQLDLARKLTPKGWADGFQSAHEVKRDAAHRRRMDDKPVEQGIVEQGPIGQLIGSSASSLNVLFTLPILGFVALFVAGFAMIWSAEASGLVELPVTFEFTIAGYIMGRKHQG